jgi:hypothetical protein
MKCPVAFSGDEFQITRLPNVHSSHDFVLPMRTRSPARATSGSMAGNTLLLKVHKSTSSMIDGSGLNVPACTEQLECTNQHVVLLLLTQLQHAFLQWHQTLSIRFDYFVCALQGCYLQRHIDS